MTLPVGNPSKVSANAAPKSDAAPAKKPTQAPAKMSFGASSISSMASQSGDKEKKAVKEGEKAFDVKEMGLSAKATSFNKLSADAFFELFPISVDTHACTDEFCQADEGHVVGSEIGDCVALFGKSDETIFVSHLSAGTSAEEVIEQLQEELGKEVEKDFLLYTFGGNGSEDSAKILKAIHAAIGKYFGKNGKLIEDCINPTAASGKEFASAALDMGGKLFFCLHDA